MTDKEINCFKENDQKQACSLEISGTGLIHVYVVIYRRTVLTQTGLATETKSDWSEFIACQAGLM